MSRINRLAVAPDLEMQSRLAFRPLTHGRDALAFFYFFAFFDQQRRRVPVGTQVGVVMLQDNKLAISDQSTARIDDAPGRRSNNGLPALAIDQNARPGPGFAPNSTLIRPLVGQSHFGEGCAGIAAEARRVLTSSWIAGRRVLVPVASGDRRTCPG